MKTTPDVDADARDPASVDQDFHHLTFEQESGALWVTLNRPDQLNALNRQMIAELRRLFSDLYWREDVRVVVIRGAGRAFCAGLDLKERSEIKSQLTIAETFHRQRTISEIIVAMRRCPQPIIALVNGAASGGGFAIALGADVRISTPDARMNAAFIRIGLSACDAGVSYFLPRMIGTSAAAEFMLTGRFIDAERARELGLVSRVVEPDQLEAEGRAFAVDMLNATPLGLRLTKDALNHSIDAAGLEAVMAIEDRNQVLATRDGNFSEAVQAFVQKRAPNFV
jgi:enoyl-CoA hydratase